MEMCQQHIGQANGGLFKQTKKDVTLETQVKNHSDANLPKGKKVPNNLTDTKNTKSMCNKSPLEYGSQEIVAHAFAFDKKYLNWF